jgi:hypothetical protein
MKGDDDEMIDAKIYIVLYAPDTDPQPCVAETFEMSQVEIPFLDTLVRIVTSSQLLGRCTPHYTPNQRTHTHTYILHQPTINQH